MSAIDNAAINYCPEHGDLLDWPVGLDRRSERCREAHNVDEIRAPMSESTWEYGVTGFDSTRPVSLRETLEGALEAHRYWIDVIKAPSRIYRRRPEVAAGAWEPVESMLTDHRGGN